MSAVSLQQCPEAPSNCNPCTALPGSLLRAEIPCACSLQIRASPYNCKALPG